jgi:hypothetical protein
MAGVAGRSGRPALAKPNSPQTGPINAIEVQPSGKLRPVTYWGGEGLTDVRTISGRFQASFQDLWERRGNEILNRVADEHPELILLSQPPRPCPAWGAPPDKAPAPEKMPKVTAEG